MKFSDAIRYYSRRDIRECMLETARNREVVASYGFRGFGKRPSTIQNEIEFHDLARRGATSFHASEERWMNPLQLDLNKTKREQDSLRTGWDLLFDIDTKDFLWAKKTTNLIVQYLRDIHKIKTIQIKFSGNKGFHIAVPFETFPKKFGEVPVERVFPDAPRVISYFIKEQIQEHLEKEIGPDPFQKVELDTIFIASRHLFRMPYSLHEKSGLASVPIHCDELMRFKKTDAIPSAVQPDVKFISGGETDEAKTLFDDASTWYSNRKEEETKHQKEILKPKEAVAEEFFPPCIKKLLQGMKDGRKRGVFILINFLSCNGWKSEEIDALLSKWNEKNEEPLREGYIKSQLNWHNKLKDEYPPPNCPHISGNENYYMSLNLCEPDNVCRLIKNPASYSYQRLRDKWK